MFDTGFVANQSTATHLIDVEQRGFTAADLTALNQLNMVATAGQLWGRAQVVSQEFAQYLAVWHNEGGLGAPPAIVLARFKKTGTYALLVGSTIVASGHELATVLPALLRATRERASSGA